jgi:hypothetical protein
MSDFRIQRSRDHPVFGWFRAWCILERLYGVTRPRSRLILVNHGLHPTRITRPVPDRAFWHRYGSATALCLGQVERRRRQRQPRRSYPYAHTLFEMTEPVINQQSTSHAGLALLLGPRQAEVMRLFWTYGAATLREIHARLPNEPALAYTSVMTICVRLTEKGLLTPRILLHASYILCDESTGNLRELAERKRR